MKTVMNRTNRTKQFLALLCGGAVSLMGAGQGWACSITAATGGTAISADTTGESWTTLAGPSLAEGVAGGIGNGSPGTIILTAPAGFEFNPDATVVVRVHGDAMAANNINGTEDNGTIDVTVTATTLTVVILSTSTAANTLTWEGIQVRPLAGSPLAQGDLTQSGTCEFQSLTGSWGTLTEVVGTFVGYKIIGPSTIVAGPAYFLRVLKTDRFLNSASDGTSETLLFSGLSNGAQAPGINNSPDGFTVGESVTFYPDGQNLSAVDLRAYVAESTTLEVTDGIHSSAAVGGGLPLTVLPDRASRLAFTVPPTGVVAGSDFSTVVQTQDQYGNNSTSGLAGTVSVTLKLTGPGTLTGTLPGDIGMGAGQGTLIFSDLRISAPGTGDLLTACASGFVSGAVTFTVDNPPVNTVLALDSSANPSPTGSSVTFTATITTQPPGTGIPSGLVQFFVDGSPAGPLVPAIGGSASFTTATLSHGYHAVAAAYDGDLPFLCSSNLLSPQLLVNTAPSASPVSMGTGYNQTAKLPVIKLLARCADADGDSLTLVSISPTSAQGGPVAISGPYVIYTPPAGYSGGDSFSYTVQDSFGATAGATVPVTVRPSNIVLAGSALLAPPPDADTFAPPLIRSLAQQSDGNLQLEISAAGQTCLVEASSDLEAWSIIGTNTAELGNIFMDLNATNFPMRFYRLALPRP